MKLFCNSNKIISLLLTIAMVMTFTMAISQYAYAENDQQTPVDNANKIKLPEPQITASAAEIYCDNTGEDFYTKNADSKAYPYSMTKLMTALIAVQHLPLDQKVIVSEEAASKGGSSMGLLAGEEVTCEELLYGALLPSGNDAAYALGEAVAGEGKMDDFVGMMNEMADNIGCTGTHFANCYGWKEDDHYTTAKDFVQITRVALADDTVRKISGTRKYKMGATNMSKARTLKTHLDLLTKKDSGVYGGKTGTWELDDCTVAVGYEKLGLELYVVLFGENEDTRESDLQSLIDYAVSNIEGVKVIGRNKKAGRVRVKHGAETRVDAMTSEVGFAYLPKEGSESLISSNAVMKDNVKAPLKKGAEVGTLEIYVGDELANKVPLLAAKSIEEGWFPSYFGISNKMSLIILCVLIVILLLFSYVIHLRRKAARQRRRRRQRQIEKIARQEAMRDMDRNRRDWNF